ncbi:FAD-dependent oxidoreductase [Actinomadura craniellae]|uniref:FAD-dependent oxidoreductase n=1 Tax=Actinomadura craniellae TaxID=2231787 RepID=A0A365HBS1_9ACTN|nr:FAD-dependent oxidoreductase [Actinomadura craniellae]RAY16555.1 FAD-dependent oxidoreductase [Actinomadura craniellae]
MKAHDVALVGGGIVGACLAEELARRGLSVVVFDAGSEPGHATPRAAGVAVPSLRYAQDTEFYRWLQAGRGRLDADIARLEPEFGTFSVARPILRALRPADAEVLAPHVEAAETVRWIDAAEAGAAAAGLKLPAGRRLLHDDTGLMVDGRRYLAAVREACLRAGVTWRQGVTVLSVEEGGSADGSGGSGGTVELSTGDGRVRADRVVITAGAWAGGDGLAAGLPVFPQRGQLAVLTGAEQPGAILSSAFYLAPGLDGTTVVGATEEDAGFDDRCTAAGIARLLTFACAAMPSLAGAEPAGLRAGLRPATRTGHPLTGRVPGRRRVYLCAGHAGHGLLSARHTAEGFVAGMLHDAWESLPISMCPTVVMEGSPAS